MKKKTHYHLSKKIQIIAGQWRGKKITIKNIPCLRPTTHKIKKTLFNWLTPLTISNSNCLDCFAGSGSLGLEALSRHAYSVTFLEYNKELCIKLKKIIESLILPHTQKTTIITTNTNIWLNQTNNRYTIAPFNIVFLDPPFSKTIYINKCIQLLEKKQYLAEKSYIYIETANTTHNLTTLNIPSNWKLHRQINTKNVSCYLYCRHQVY